MKRLSVVLVASALSMLVTPGLAGEAQVFDLGKALSDAPRGRPAVNVSLVKMPDYTVNAVLVKDEIPLHRHENDSHVLYVVSGRGTATLDGKPVALKPGMVIHIPQGIDHSIKAEGGEVRLVDFARHSRDSGGTDKK